MFILIIWSPLIRRVHRGNDRDHRAARDDRQSRGASYGGADQKGLGDRNGHGQDWFLDESEGRYRPCHAEAVDDNNGEADPEHDQKEGRETDQEYQTYHDGCRHYENYSDKGDAICSADQRHHEIRSGGRETW